MAGYVVERCGTAGPHRASLTIILLGLGARWDCSITRSYVQYLSLQAKPLGGHLARFMNRKGVQKMFRAL